MEHPFYCLSYPDRKIPATGRVDIDLGKHKVELFTELAEKAAAGSPGRVHHPCVYLDPVEIEAGKQVVESRLAMDPRRLLCLCPGGGKNPGSLEPSKRWATGRYGELVRMILDETDFGIILLGNGDDSPLLDELAASSGDVRRVVSITDLDLRRAAAVINTCSLVVGNDSGLMHIAAALARPTITIFGPTEPSHVRPYSPASKVLSALLPCSPCDITKRDHRNPVTCSTMECMKQIDPVMVMAEIKKTALEVETRESRSRT